MAVARYEEFIDLTALAEANRARRTRLWHGGVPGLRVGDWILPPAETGAESIGDVSRALGFTRVVSRLDRAYVTTDRQLALALASGYGRRDRAAGRGSLYAVEVPAGATLEADDDFPLGPFATFQLGRAEVVQVHSVLVDPQDQTLGRYLKRFVAEADRRGAAARRQNR